MGCLRSDAGAFFFILLFISLPKIRKSLFYFCTENPKNKKNFDVFLCLQKYKNI